MTPLLIPVAYMLIGFFGSALAARHLADIKGRPDRDEKTIASILFGALWPFGLLFLISEFIVKLWNSIVEGEW